MALPPQRTNLCTNPGFEVSSANWTNVNGGTVGRNTSFFRTGAASGLVTFPTFTGQAGIGTAITTVVGVSYTVSVWVKTTVAGKVCIQWNGVQSAKHSGSNSWEKLTITGAASATTTQFYVVANDPTSGQAAYVDDAFVETTSTADGTSWDGSTVETGWTYAWTGTAGLSTSTRNVYGLWVDVETSGTARTQLTVLGLGGTPAITKIIRNDGRQSWPVPGWLGRNTIDADTETDWTVPLGRPVTYTLLKDGIAVASRTVTVNATVGDIMDPLDPQGAMKIAVNSTDPTMLALSTDALRETTYENTSSDREYPLGGRYPIARPGVRASAQKIPVILNAARNATSDDLLTLIESAPIVLIRSLPSWGSVPPLLYTDGGVREAPFNRGRGGQFTQWEIDASAVAPVTRRTNAGRVTNDQVKANLAGRTHASIKAASGNKRHVEIKANPLGLGS